MVPICSFTHSFTYSPIYALKKRWGSHCGDSKKNKGVSPVRTLVIQGRKQECVRWLQHSQGTAGADFSNDSRDGLLPVCAGQGSGFGCRSCWEHSNLHKLHQREKAVSFSSSKIWIIPWSTELNTHASSYAGNWEPGKEIGSKVHWSSLGKKSISVLSLGKQAGQSSPWTAQGWMSLLWTMLAGLERMGTEDQIHRVKSPEWCASEIKSWGLPGHIHDAIHKIILKWILLYLV